MARSADSSRPLRTTTPDLDLGARFRDVRLLHTGDRFTTYEARESDAARPEDTVVVKATARHAAPWLVDVLEQEGELLTDVGRHPNVISLHDRVTLPDGRPALVLERCVASVADTLPGGEALELPQVTSLGIKLAGALEIVHGAGVLHCDVRPENVLLDRLGEPVLSGFDEAVRASTAATGTLRAPLHVTTVHTAPELLEGDEASTATDVYGLASTLYELLAGRTAFRAYVGESPAAVVVRILSGRVRPITLPDVPLAMSDLLTWGLAPNPADRPPGPAWIAEELSRIELDAGLPRTSRAAG